MKCVLKGLSRCKKLSSLIIFQKKCRPEFKSLKIRKTHLDQTIPELRHKCAAAVTAHVQHIITAAVLLVSIVHFRTGAPLIRRAKSPRFRVFWVSDTLGR